MQTQLKKILPLLIVLTGLTLTGAFTYGLSLVLPPLESNPVKSISLSETDPTPTPAPQDSKLDSASITITPTPTPTTLSANDTNITPQITPSSTPTPTNPPLLTPTTSPTTTPAPTTHLQLTLQIDNDPPFDLEVDSPKNHCQVLEAALAQGKLSSLNLKFFPSLSSYAVYQINGLGDTNQVWWTYSVNGQQPPYGCSQVMVNQGDVIHWTYAGSR
jgi:hypothetical protein